MTPWFTAAKACSGKIVRSVRRKIDDASLPTYLDKFSTNACVNERTHTSLKRIYLGLKVVREKLYLSAMAEDKLD